MQYSDDTVAAYIGFGFHMVKSCGEIKSVPSLMEYHVNERNQTLKSFPITEESVLDKEALQKAINSKDSAFNQVRIWVREGYFWAGVFTKGPCWQKDRAEAKRLASEYVAAERF